MNENQNLINLLNSISSILKKYENHAALTGENFNIFSLLGVQYDEVRTHSAMLSDLLNPKGSHGQGSIFLEKFVTQFDIKNFDFKNAKCEKEKYIGAKTLETGGRIDIYIEDIKKNKILIENKIYAPEQKNQVLRYTNVDKNAHVFYLTLEGNEPSNYSKKELKEKEDFKCISYCDDIVKWLYICKKEATDLPILRETITQYIHLIKILTNQTTSIIMNNEITKVILKSDDALKAYFDSYNEMGNVLDEIIVIFKNQLIDLKTKLEKERKIQLEFDFDLQRNDKETGFSFYTEKMINHNFIITFQFEGKWTTDFFFGFEKHDDTSKTKPFQKIRKHIWESFNNEFKNQVKPDDEWWLAWQWHQLKNWNLATFFSIYNREIIEDIESKLNVLLNIAQSVDEL